MNHKQILNQAFSHHRNGRTEAAETAYRQLLKAGFKHEAVINNLSAILTERQQYDDAIKMICDYPETESSAVLQSTLAAVYKFKGDLDQSVIHAQKALEIDPAQPDTWNNLGSSLRSLGKWDEAILALNEAVGLKGQFTLALYNLGNAYLEKRDLKNAIHYYDRAIDSDPSYASSHVNKGNCYRELRNFQEAEKSYIRAFELDNSLIETQFNLGVIYMEQSRFTDAIECFSKTITTTAYGTQSIPHLIGATQKICDWTHTETLRKMAIEAIDENKYHQCPPFNLISILDDPRLMRLANEQYTSTHIKPPSIVAPPTPLVKGKIKIAYFSADIHEHATGYLIAELFELHDFSKFEILLISYGPNSSNSKIRHRIQRSKVKFVDASLWSDPTIIEFIKTEETHVLIDLKGYTAGCRPQVLAARPAPIQIQYLGYPATMGASFIDYFIGDQITTPADFDQWFSEKILRHPNCYQINDSKREIAATEISRESEGLPENAVIFASFNSSYKITPALWAIWMSILKVVPNSVLWLLGDNDWAKLNLVQKVKEAGLDEGRLLFAEKKPQAEHLERLRLADLALDTFPCCGHTTTSDALYAGLPVLTLAGNSFHSRVSASLLSAQGLDELITHSISEYATTAVTITSSRESIENLKDKILRSKKTGVLFNTPEWVKHYEEMLVSLIKTTSPVQQL